jgi:hypothetical protein
LNRIVAPLLVNSSTHTVSPTIRSNLPFDPTGDLRAIIPLGNMPVVMVVNPSKGYKKLSDGGHQGELTHPTSTAIAARRVSRHSRNRPDPTTIAEPIRRLRVGTSPQMANPNITAHTNDR